jgi:hypothetical protein
MMAADAPDAAGLAAGDCVAAGERPGRQVLPGFGSGYRAIDDHVVLIHRGEVLTMSLATAIAMRDALSAAINIPDRARRMASSG